MADFDVPAFEDGPFLARAQSAVNEDEATTFSPFKGGTSVCEICEELGAAPPARQEPPALPSGGATTSMRLSIGAGNIMASSTGSPRQLERTLDHVLPGVPSGAKSENDLLLPPRNRRIHSEEFSQRSGFRFHRRSSPARDNLERTLARYRRKISKLQTIMELRERRRPVRTFSNDSILDHRLIFFMRSHDRSMWW